MGFFKSLDEMEPEIEDVPIGANFSTVEYTFDSFLKKIEDGSISDNKIRSNIEYSYNIYLDYDNFKNPNTRRIFQSLWTNERFLKNLLEVLKNNPNILNSLRSFHITTINTIANDYHSIDNENEKDSLIVNLLLDICRVVDMKYIIPLSTIMNTNSALYITMMKFSSFDQDKCVKRLNDFIITIGIDFSVKDIIYIYSIFYNEGFSTLFNYTMIYCDYYFSNKLQEKINDNISLAIINILNSMTSEEIFKVLKQYGNYISLTNKGGKVRFSLRNLSNDFSRVSNIVDNLNSDYLFIP